MRNILSACALVVLSACSQHPSNLNNINEATFDEARFRQDIKILSSDSFEGRAPTTKGEALTLAYLSDAFAAMGLEKPNGKDYLQAVPMVTYTPSAQQQIQLGEMPLTYRQDVVMTSRHDIATIDISNAPLVFVGYGINAPEYQWNDYQDLDMTGKIAVILVNDPGFALPNSGKFNGKAMTYYGRWSYKFEEASRQGALGAIIIHDTKPASYPWSVVENSWTGAQQDLANTGQSHKRVQVEGWITYDIADKLFKNTGLSLATIADRAAASPIHLPLNQNASIAFTNQAEYSNSYNVVATLPGQTRADEQILFTAHWDHIGIDPNKEGDQIYNGALDNASGTAGILEIARQFASQANQGNRLDRSLTFIATTGEEQGLLGSRYYADNPLYSLDKTVAVFNLDSTNVYGRTSDYTIIGKGKSELEEYLIDALKRQNRTAVAENRPEAGGFFRSDHFSFAKKGIPAVFAGGGNEPIDEATAKYKVKMQQKMKGCYHNVCDEYRSDWDLSGALEDLDIFYQAAATLGNNKDWPGYYKGTEFNALRPAKDDSNN